VFSLFALIAISALAIFAYMALLSWSAACKAGSRLRLARRLRAHRSRFLPRRADRSHLGRSRGGGIPLALHWWLVVVIYFLVIKSFGGKLGTLTFTDAMLVLVFTMVGSAITASRRGRRCASALHRCIHSFVWSRTGSSSCLCDGAVAGHVCFVYAGRCAHPVREGWSLGDLRRMSQREDEQIDAEIAAR